MVDKLASNILSSGGLHLTKQGNELLYKNFASCLVAKEANNHWTVFSNADRLIFHESDNNNDNCYIAGVFSATVRPFIG